MHKIEFMIRQYLEEVNDGRHTVPADLSDGFGDECKSALKRHFEDTEGRLSSNFRIRASNIGKPLCQLQYEKRGDNGGNRNPVRNLYGDIIEDIVYVLLRGAGVPITSWQEPVELDLGYKPIQGTLDVVIDFGNDPRVWDIKSASGWSFEHKFDSFDDVFKYDNFGYCDQLFVYAAAKGVKAGGWIIVDKSSGDVKVLEVPDNQDAYKDIILRMAKEKVKTLNDPTVKEVQKQFHPIPERFKKKFTGKYVLDKACTFCSHKFECWPSARLDENTLSEAKEKPLKWYVDKE